MPHSAATAGVGTGASEHVPLLVLVLVQLLLAVLLFHLLFFLLLLLLKTFLFFSDLSRFLRLFFYHFRAILVLLFHFHVPR